MQKFTGKDYLKIDIANSFGKDKLSWNDRIAWFDANEASLESQTRAAKEPAQFMAGVQAYRLTMNGQPTGYLCGLDATASGLQLLSVLSGCPTSGAMCNLVDTGRREDAYVNTHEVVCGLLGVSPQQFPIPREKSKQALMTYLYGSKAVPKEVFGEDTRELRAFHEAVDLLMPGANDLNQGLIGLWNPNVLAHAWTLPDGFECVINVMDHDVHYVDFLGHQYKLIERVNRPMESGLSLGANIVHSVDGMVVREMGRRCMYDRAKVDTITELFDTDELGYSVHRKKDISLLRILSIFEVTGFMSAVILEFMDEKNMGHIGIDAQTMIEQLITSLPKKAFSLVCIHDCFKFHANYGNDVRQQYINILAELADSDVLDSIVSALTGQVGAVRKYTTTLSNEIRQSEYAIC